MFVITIRPHSHIVDLFWDDDDNTWDTWLGRTLPTSAARRLERYQALATTRLLDAIDGAVVDWSSDRVYASGGVGHFTLAPEDEAVRRHTEHILGQTLQEVCQWDPAEDDDS